MTAEHHILEETDIPLCADCIEDARRFCVAVMNTWQGMCASDETFCFVVVMLADLIRFEEARQPEKMDAEYKRYIGRKLQTLGVAIAGDVQ